MGKEGSALEEEDREGMRTIEKLDIPLLDLFRHPWFLKAMLLVVTATV